MKIEVEEFRQRRDAVMTKLDGAVAVVFAGEGSPPLLGKWRPESNFLYLTGLESEAGAAVLFDPSAENPRNRCVLYLRPLNPERERWDGFRDPIGSALKAATGFQTVTRSDSLPGALTQAARRSKRLACLHPFSTFPAALSPDLDHFKKIAERIPGVQIEDRTDLLLTLRAVKSTAELGLMRKAIGITALGFANAIKSIRPGATENEVAQALENTYRQEGAQGVAYNSIVGSGFNGTVLHYVDNQAELKDGDLLVIDSGASFGNYAADITRTFPVNGRFGPEQREIYELVLKAEMAAIQTVHAGATMAEIDEAARQVIEKAGHGDAFIHSIGHPLGIQVHEGKPDGPILEGMIVTIEPGLYFPDRKMGVRIEDDVLVLKDGCEVLSKEVPKTVAEVEAAFRDCH